MPRADEAIDRGARMGRGHAESQDGGWGAFDADNSYHYLNNIPFADHGALLDPPTVDVSARCVSMLAQLGASRRQAAHGPRLAYLEKEQEADGSWFGRWGVNYVYGTWSALCALNAAGLPLDAPMIAQARSTGWSRSRMPTAAGARIATAMRSTTPATTPAPVDRVADRLGAARADGGGRGRHPGRRARHRLSAGDAGRPTGCGARSTIPAAVSRASSTCAITAIRNISRSGRWRATAG